MDKVFINNSFTKAIDDYLKSSDNVQGVMYNSFLVVVIRMLVAIYSELDIINPKIIDDEDLLKENLAKFGYDKSDVLVFLSNIQLFWDFENENDKRKVKKKNPYFILIQKELVDMLIKKKLNFYLTEAEVREFYDLLYTPYSKNPLRVSYNFLQASDVMEVDKYFKVQMKNNVKVIDSIVDFSYTLDERDTKLMKDNYQELKNILKEREIDYKEYAKVLAKLFVIDLFTMDNKINKYDVACLEYVYPDNLENFKTNVEDTIYKLMEDNTYGKRTEKLSIVNNVEITNEEESTFKINEEEVPSYVVTLNWTYDKDLGYDKNATITMIKKDKKLYVVEYKAGAVNE